MTIEITASGGMDEMQVESKVLGSQMAITNLGKYTDYKKCC